VNRRKSRCLAPFAPKMAREEGRDANAQVTLEETIGNLQANRGLGGQLNELLLMRLHELPLLIRLLQKRERESICITFVFRFRFDLIACSGTQIVELVRSTSLRRVRLLSPEQVGGEGF
jgi:hypothetical protein